MLNKSKKDNLVLSHLRDIDIHKANVYFLISNCYFY